MIVRLPAGLTVASPPAGCTSFRSAAGLDLTCNLAELDVNADVDLTFLVKAPAWVGTVGAYHASVESTSASGGPAYPEPDGKAADNVIEREVVTG